MATCIRFLGQLTFDLFTYAVNRTPVPGVDISRQVLHRSACDTSPNYFQADGGIRTVKHWRVAWDVPYVPYVNEHPYANREPEDTPQPLQKSVVPIEAQKDTTASSQATALRVSSGPRKQDASNVSGGSTCHRTRGISRNPFRAGSGSSGPNAESRS